MEASEVVSLAASTPTALPCGGTLGGAALGMDGKVRASATDAGGFYVQWVVTYGAVGGVGGEKAYRCGGGGDEAEAVVKLDFYVPFREVFRGPFDHVLCLSVF